MNATQDWIVASPLGALRLVGDGAALTAIDFQARGRPGAGHPDDPVLRETAAQLTAGPTAPRSGESGPAPSASESPAAAESPTASESPTGPVGPPTPDPVASELDLINELINDINNSVQSSDSSQQGGE